MKNLLKMACSSILTPPAAVRGMKVLEKAAFAKKICVPCFTIKTSTMDLARKALKPYLLKLEKFQPVLDYPGDPTQKKVLLNPETVNSLEDLKENDRNKIKELGHKLESTEIEVGFDNWRSDQILRAVLPEGEEGSKGYTIIGHILHLNLREHLIPFKGLIAKVLLEKTKNIRTVVNKVDNIENTYRNFQMEVLAGDNDLVTSVKENNCQFHLDFGLVYWNSRLSTEHSRITDKIKTTDVIYDIFAGIGPFAIPAALKGARVMANDLNPESFKWLEHNVKVNKAERRGGSVRCFNKDGREFILSDVKDDLEQVLKSDAPVSKVHIVMNLPAIASTFLDALRGLVNNSCAESNIPVIVHVYCFARDFEPEKLALELIEKDAGFKLGGNLIELKIVRKVAPSKHMVCVSFSYPLSKLCGEGEEEPVKKKPCLE
ncbi:tRNA (guanine(37)-N1)-methyltransferase isoform X2 [Neocloeon triangulifer]|uniref:tRNA (guanine(37)-N1)-methyltransferase isoform X2 n=1 Tax=Neocloeon triangulifer TaxID=2078957 RepID=UPI00286F2070|nr:tRNA (guanine(37)-N1)-methyltransferase isoform X2 [Neocloeon triangulifer]